MFRKLIGLSACGVSLWAACPAAQVTTTYEYDGNNRLVAVVRVGPPVDVSVSSMGAAVEGSGLLFRVSVDGTVSANVDVDLVAEGLSATAGTDFDDSSISLTFEPGDQEFVIPVPTMTDSLYESDETVRLRITNVDGNGVADMDEAIGTITNTTPAPSFAINNRTVDEGGNAVFTVTKSGQTTMTHALSYTTQNGSALAGQDYSARSGTLSFSAGQTSKSISVPTLNDQTNESNETFDVKLSSATNGASFADSSGRGTIRNVFYNTPPSASNDGPVIMQAGNTQILDVLANDSDPDGHTLDVTSVSAPNFVYVSIRTDNKLTINGQSAGTGTMTYTISDGHGGTATASIPLDIADEGGFVF